AVKVVPNFMSEANAAPVSVPVADPLSVSPIANLHLQFGSDATSEMIVSWHSLAPVQNPRVLLGSMSGKLEKTVAATVVSYVDDKSKQTVYAYHTHLTALDANTEYMYAAIQEGTDPAFGNFTTAPQGRAAFTFTSFGDQGTPTLGKQITAIGDTKLPNPIFVNDNLGSPAAADSTMGVEKIAPLFHLLNGDLCYANIAEDRVRTWWDFWENNSRSARNRPWMPAAGNHENEKGNGPIGYLAYQTFFALPPTEGQAEAHKGLWYAFTAGAMRVISLANDDICYQDGGNTYVRGYSGGAQKAWLEKELAATRADKNIDWIVVCMHQVAISTADKFNGADLAIREEWLPLFDKYNVDLVVCGHEHHYERSHPIRGQQQNKTLTPLPVGTAIDVIDTTKGTVHMVIGGGGTSVPSNKLFYDPPQCRVITGVDAFDPKINKRPPIYVLEDAPWSAVRNAANAYGFAGFKVDPGQHPGDFTTIEVTYYDIKGINGQLSAYEKFTLKRPRNDA
ncbi:MAG: metallophosphoesterase family protein, partial [Pseudomonadota bacterium]|nr:metallophosphoesterase family protein [Pseudomonadota bacterium]